MNACISTHKLCTTERSAAEFFGTEHGSLKAILNATSSPIFERAWHKKEPERKSRALWRHQGRPERSLERSSDAQVERTSEAEQARKSETPAFAAFLNQSVISCKDSYELDNCQGPGFPNHPFRTEDPLGCIL